MVTTHRDRAPKGAGPHGTKDTEAPAAAKKFRFPSAFTVLFGVTIAVWWAPRRGVGWRGRGLEAAVAVSACLQILAVAWGPLRDLLGTRTISGSDALVILCLAALPGAVLAAVRLAGWGRETSRA